MHVLTSLRIAMQLGNDECKMLVHFCPGIVHLDARRNDFDWKGLLHLSRGLVELKELHLSRNNGLLTIEAVNHVFGMKKNFAKLQLLGLQVREKVLQQMTFQDTRGSLHVLATANAHNTIL